LLAGVHGPLSVMKSRSKSCAETTLSNLRESGSQQKSYYRQVYS
jgi:hypothetical protein